MNIAAAGGNELQTHQIVGRILGPTIFVLMLITSGSQELMEPVAWHTAAVALWMAIWWSTEAIPVAVTALLPLVLFDPLGVFSIKEAAAPYAHWIVFLFMGGFLLALAVERWNLHRRIALAVLSRTGTDSKRLIGGFMLVCALLSMWMTNTSTTMMLLPIALSVITVMLESVEGLPEQTRINFRIGMLLGIAYAASIGGLGTIIGTPPNGLLIGVLRDTYGIDISFARWMIIGIPMVLVMLPIAWLFLTRFLFPCPIPASPKAEQHLKRMRDEMGPMSTAEKRVAVLFGLVIACWMLRRPATEWLQLEGVSDTMIVIAAAIAMFIIPSGDKTQKQLMTWDYATRLPWGVLILFGGGLSLAAAVSDSGLALWLGQTLEPLSAWGIVVLIIASVTLVIFLTELTSNLATTATLLPVMGALAVQAGVPIILLLVPMTIAASCAFMLPVATPPNAIVFSTGMITIPQMAKAGIGLNIIGIIMISIIAYFVAPELLQ